MLQDNEFLKLIFHFLIDVIVNFFAVVEMWTLCSYVMQGYTG